LKIMGAPALPAIAELLEDSDKKAREHAARLSVLKMMGASAEPAIAELLKDPDRRARECAVRLLAQMRKEDIRINLDVVLPKILAALGTLGIRDDALLVQCIENAGTGAIPALNGVVERGPEHAKKGGINALWKLAETHPEYNWETSIRLLTKLLRSRPEIELQAGAANAIAKMAVSRYRYCWNDAISALKDAADGGVMEAIDALGKIPDPLAISVLAGFLASRDMTVGMRAAEALGSMAYVCPKEVAYAIVEFVNGKDGDRMIEINARNDRFVHAVNGIMLRCAKAMENAA